jgi:SAM-dependent methyltransferase
MFNEGMRPAAADAVAVQVGRSRARSAVRLERPAETGEFLVIGETALRSAARLKAPARSLLAIFLRQAYYEEVVRRWKRIPFRAHRNDDVRRAYCAMNTVEFEGINARQSWANWRTIPRNLSGRAAERPLDVIDLCCGTGHSTEVLAYYLPVGSSVLGLEYNPRFVEVARSRQYRHGRGGRVAVRFNAQSVLERFEEPDGQRVADRSVDLANSSGAVGCHFDPETTRVLAGEVARVLRPGGLAMIDSGPGGTAEPELRAIFEEAGFLALHRARSCFLDRYTQVCFRKRGEAP